MSDESTPSTQAVKEASKPRGWRAVATPGVAVICFFGVVVAAWVISNPLGGTPDEIDHYVRALSVSGGELVGSAAPDRLRDRAERAKGPVEQLQNLDIARVVDVPARLDVGRLPCQSRLEDDEREALFGPRCSLGQARSSPAQRITVMGTREPVAYVVPGLAARLADGPARGLRASRLANGLIAIALFAGAIFAYRRLYGDDLKAAFVLLVVTTPMVLFVAATPSPSALEIAATIAVFPATLLILDRRREVTTTTWVFLTIAAVLLVTSRNTGIVWLGVALVSAAGLVGWKRLRPLGRAGVVSGSIVVLAALSTIVWNLSVQPGSDVDWTRVRDQLGPAATDIGRTLKQSIGIFGVTGNILLPDVAVYGWLLGVAALVVVAIIVGRRRERLTIVAVIAFAWISVIVLSLLVLRQTEGSIQGRHVMPALLLIPLCAAHVVCKRCRVAPGLVMVVGVLAVGANALALWVNKSAYSAGGPLRTGPTRFAFDRGSLVWPLIVGAAGLALIAVVAIARRSQSPSRQPPRSDADTARGIERSVASDTFATPSRRAVR